ncbi:50S ribosomal protein L11 methyltransferase [Cribrihabitans neustonicus]|uniref:50S ribosomal protein L11 methyltransferase n=1 Tax=Cribrihabitans neustonicus TaxID=1429085 RepID=UPI003B5C8D63
MLQRQTPRPSPDRPHQASQEAERLVQLAKSETLADGGLRTSQILAAALAKDPQHHEAQVLQERLHQMFVPRWHFPMLADTARNQAYASAIAAKVKPGDVVLDIGCGAGLTAMLAARAGAKHVYTCEQQPLIAEAAARVIADNGLSDRITVIPKWSHDIVVGEDIPERADVVISEIVDTVLLGEGALATLTHAMGALAKPDARAIPERGTLVAQLVESRKLLDLWRPQEAEGFDLSAFHRLARVAQITPNDLDACELRSLGPVTGLFSFDFTRPSMTPARATEDLACTRTGTAHAVFVSFEMELAPGIEVSNGLNSGGHWGRTAFLLDRPEQAGPGDSLKITAQHDASQLSVSVHGWAPRMEAAEHPAVWVSQAWKERRRPRAGDSFTLPAGASWNPAEAKGPQANGPVCH